MMCDTKSAGILEHQAQEQEREKVSSRESLAYA